MRDDLGDIEVGARGIKQMSLANRLVGVPRFGFDVTQSRLGYL